MPIIPIPNASLPREVNGIPMMDLPGGVFAMGSAEAHRIWGNCPPHMVRLSPFAAGVTHVPRDEYLKTMGRQDCKCASGRHPITSVTVPECKEFLQRRNQGKGPDEQIGFLTEAELEYIARGPVVDVRQLMKEKGLRDASALAAYLTGKDGYFLENFVSALDLGAAIIATPETLGFDDLIDGASPVFAWRVWGTPSGKLNPLDAWYGREDTAPVTLTQRLNGYGISDAVSQVMSWGADGYRPHAYRDLPQDNPYNQRKIYGRGLGDDIVLRGGHYGTTHPNLLRAACRGYAIPDGRSPRIGLRVGALAKTL